MNSSPNTPIIDLIEKEIGFISYRYIEELIRSLSPQYIMHPSMGIFEHLLNTILEEHERSLLFSLTLEDVNFDIITRASKVNQALSIRLKSLFCSSEFLKVIRNKRGNQKTFQNSLKMIENKNQQLSSQSKGKSDFNFEVIKRPSQKYQYMNINKLAQNKSGQNCLTCLHKPQCICPNQRQIVNKDELSFQCVHCERLFHTVCMKKKSHDELCIYCHIQRMVPVKKVMQTVFLGVLRRNTKKHTAKIFFPPIEPHQKFQVRCIRIKEGAPSSCLFPDIAQITLNEHHIKDFEPINKQSCLKYRKDQPFNLIRGDYYPNVENSFSLNQSPYSSKEKEIRYDSQNHLFGIFVVEDIKISDLIEQIKEANTLGFTESSSKLNDCFARFGKGDDDLICQLVKIPLYCPLSITRIQIPARGVFCNHFQCFDLKNYLTLISESVNPRWNCPLCRSFACELQVDPIMLQILKNIKQNDKIQQVLFFKNGDYTGIIDDQPERDRKNIKNLNIPEKKKRVLPPVEEEKPQKKQFVIPQNAEIIELDD